MFRELARRFSSEQEVSFSLIGQHTVSNGLQTVEPMSHLELQESYSLNCDVFLNLETGLAFNGWPLGREAAKNGSAILTTDTQTVAQNHKGAETQLWIGQTIGDFEGMINQLRSDSSHLEQLKASAFDFVSNWSGVENQQDRFLSLHSEMATTPLKSGSRARHSAPIRRRPAMAIWAPYWRLTNYLNPTLRRVVHAMQRIRKP